MSRQEQRIRFQKFIYNAKIWLVSFSYKNNIHRRAAELLKKWKTRTRYTGNLKYVLPGCILALVLGTGFLLTTQNAVSGIAENAPEQHAGVLISYDGREFGWIKSKQVLYGLQQEFPPEDRWFFTEPCIKRNLRYTSEFTETPEEETQKTLENLRVFISPRQVGFSISVNGEIIAKLHSKEACTETLERIVDWYTPKPEEEQTFRDLKVSVLEKTDIEQGLFDKKDLFTPEDAFTYLLKGTLEEKNYTVIERDTIWSISRKHGLTMEEIIEANPDINPDYIYPGDTLSLIVPKPYVTVLAEYETEFFNKIQYYTSVKKDPGLYRTEAIIERPGTYGKERVVARIKLTNGLLQERQTLEEEIILQPVTAIVRQGTARTPNDILVASAILPSGIGVITSLFGPRWGRFHYGIDVSAPLGTPVYAYMAGTVSQTGYDPVLGNMVAITHGPDLVTRYGHASALVANTGQKVVKGQVIALSGNTGYSTGPHVHFEVRKKGIAIDPLQYLLSQ